MKYKTIIGLILSFIMIFSSISAVSATNVDDINIGNINVACFENAEQFKNKATDMDIVNDYAIDFSLGNNSLEIQGNVEGTTFSVFGVLATRNVRNTNLAYSATDMSGKYNVLYMCVDKEPNEFVILNDFVSDIENYSNVIKLYMQEKTTGNYIMIEIYIEYDFVGNYLANYTVTNNEALASEMFSWFTNHIEAENGTDEVATRATNTRRFKRQFSFGSDPAYYNLIVRFTANANNITINGSSVSEAYIEVITSNISNKSGSETWGVQYTLTLQNINISYATIPNTIIVEHERFGTGVTLNSHLTEYRKADFFASLSVINTGTMTTGIYGTHEPGENETEGIRMLSTGYVTINNSTGVRINNVILCEVGDKYGFRVTIQDKGGVATSGKPSIGFDYTIDCPDDPANNFTDHYSMTPTQTVS